MRAPSLLGCATVLVVGMGLGPWPVTAAAQPAPPTPTRQIFLTFDADMTPGMLKHATAGRRWYDPAIVTFLHDHGVPATIFMAGLFVEAYPEFVKQIAADPLFDIGSHGYAHSAYASPCYGLAILAGDAAKSADLSKAREAIERIAGRPPTRFRYPGLCHTAHDDNLVKQSGLLVDVPTITSGDAFNPDATAIVEQVLRLARSGGVVVFHLGGPNAPATLAALQSLVPALRARGYEFKALNDRR